MSGQAEQQHKSSGQPDEVSPGPGARGRQLLAILAFVLLGLLVLLVLVSVLQNLGSVILAVVGLAVAAWGGWWMITEAMQRRVAGFVGLLVGLLIIAVALSRTVTTGPSALLRLFLAVALAAGALWCARAAISREISEIITRSDLPDFQPRHAVLICNPKSGGGKVEKFGIVAKARAMGVEVVMLEPGSDLQALARDAVARGADCLAMAGGDGSQALVADVAIEHGVPFAVISAGTRNHLALDLGIDRDDPSRGLAAFRGGVLRRVDYARVGDRLFVNNVSLGVYAEVVDQDSYRDAKLATTRAELPELLGSTAEPFDLQFTTPDGREVAGAFVILVSNNPYVLGPALDLAQRRSMSTGKLGVVAVSSRTGAEAAALVARAALGRADRDPNFHVFTTKEFQVRSRSGTANAGVDGEALTLDTPLDFTIHHKGLTLLVAVDNPEVTALRHYRSYGMAGLWRIARGKEA